MVFLAVVEESGSAGGLSIGTKLGWHFPEYHRIPNHPPFPVQQGKFCDYPELSEILSRSAGYPVQRDLGQQGATIYV